MVWVLAVTETVAYGALYYAFAVFLIPMRDAFEASTLAITAAFSLAIAVSGLAAPLVGRWLDARGARAVMTAGSAIATVSLVAWSMAENLLQLYACFVGLGVAWAMVLYEPAFVLINRWFVRDRPSALLTLTVVAGLASAIFMPIAQLLITGLGWRQALLVLAGIIAVCGVLHACMLRSSPSDVGLTPDGVRPEPAPARHGSKPAGHVPRATALEARQAWGRTDVRWLTVATVAETAAITIIAVHLVTYLFDTGTPAAVAATAAGALGLMSVAGRVLLTGGARRWGIARVTACMVAAQALGVAALPLLPRPAGIVVFVLLFGLGFGVMTLARASMLGSYVPEGIFGRVSGMQTLIVNTSRVAAPLAVGATIVWTGGYALLLSTVAACTLLAAAALWRADAAHRADARR